MAKLLISNGTDIHTKNIRFLGWAKYIFPGGHFYKQPRTVQSSVLGQGMVHVRCVVAVVLSSMAEVGRKWKCDRNHLSSMLVLFGSNWSTIISSRTYCLYTYVACCKIERD